MKIITADVFSRLPAAFRHTGPPSAWAAMTRPGQAMHSFLEGPAYDARGDLWLADVPYGRIFRIDPAGSWHLGLEYAGEPHSLRPMADGRFAIVDYSRGLLAFDPRDGGLETLAADDGDDQFLGLSDLTVAANGDIWFTDSGRTSLSDARGRLYRRTVDGAIERVLSMLPYPNGVVLSADGATVFVAVTRANAVWRLAAGDPARPPMAGVYVQLSGGLGPDGLAMSGDGFLAVAHARAGRALVFDPRGDAVAEVRTPGGMATTAVAFNGDDTLVITEADEGTVYRVPAAHWRS